MTHCNIQVLSSTSSPPLQPPSHFSLPCSFPHELRHPLTFCSKCRRDRSEILQRVHPTDVLHWLVCCFSRSAIAEIHHVFIPFNSLSFRWVLLRSAKATSTAKWPRCADIHRWLNLALQSRPMSSMCCLRCGRSAHQQLLFAAVFKLLI